MIPWGLIGRDQDAEVEEQPNFHSELEQSRFHSEQPTVFAANLKEVEVNVTVRGYTAKVDASLAYHNDTDTDLEAEFRMPLDEDAAVCNFEAHFEGQKISALYAEKKMAERLYRNAVKTRHTKILGKEDALTTDIYHVTIGNLPRGSHVEVKLSIVMELKVQTDGAVSFTLPTVLNPRYCPRGMSSSKHTESVAQTGNSATAIVLEAYTFDINAKVQGGDAIARITSNRESLNVELSEDNMSAEVTPDSSGFRPDHDWSMLIYYANPYKAHIIREPADLLGTGFMKDDIVMINFRPEFPEESYSHKNEIFFVVDCSGSMKGDSMQSARATFLLFLKSLPTGCYFNVISFGSKYSVLFPDGSQEYTEETLKKALELHSTMEADMGGTEILQPIQEIYSTPPKSGYAKQIILLTDGEVTNVDEVKELVSRNAHETRVFAVGIGDGASTALVYGLARAGRGHAEMVYQQDELQLKVMGLVKSMLQESAQDVKVSFDLDPHGQIKVIPENPPIIFGGQYLAMYVRVPTIIQVKSITVSGVIGKAEFKNCYSESDIVIIHDEGKSLHRLAARAQINEWHIDNGDDVAEDMVNLSSSMAVASKRASLLTVDEDMKIVGHNPLGRGIHGQPYGGGFSFDALEQAMPPDPCSLESSIGPMAGMYPPYDERGRPSIVSDDQPPVDYKNNILAVVLLQRFDGSWSLDDALRITNVPRSLCPGVNTYRNDTSWGTALVLAFLDRYFPAVKDKWTSLENKGHVFIDKCGNSVEALTRAAKKIMAEV